jgi:hypothetical protein
VPVGIEQVRKVEARKRGADVSISSAAEPFLSSSVKSSSIKIAFLKMKRESGTFSKKNKS